MSQQRSTDPNRFGPQSAGVWQFAQKVAAMTDSDLTDFVAAYNKRDIKASRAANEKLRPPAALLTAIELLFRQINEENSLIERVISIDDWVGSDIVSSARLAARAITLRHEQLSDSEFEAVTGVYTEVGFDCHAMSNMGLVSEDDEPTIQA